MSQDVTFKLKDDASDLYIDFQLEDSRITTNTPIDPDKIDIEGGYGKLKIKVHVDRKGNSGVASWFKDFVNNEKRHMMHTRGGDAKPSKLNLALSGWLKIGDVVYSVCFGQGSSGAYNNWHFCSYSMEARDDNKSGYLNNIYYFSTHDSDEFRIKYAEDIDTGKGIELWAYTGADTVYPRFEMEGDTLHPFPYKDSDLPGVGAMGFGKAFDTTGIFPEHRDFHIQAMASNGSQLYNRTFKIDRITGGISGDTVAEQTVKEFTDANNNTWLMNYGVSHVPPPITDQSYNYLGMMDTNWMGNLANNCPGIKLKQLVLPGAHDAGMYTLNWDGFSFLEKTASAWLEQLIPVGKHGIDLSSSLRKVKFETAVGNFSIPQKDNAYDQMKSGTRYFDFRPAYEKGGQVDDTYHIHNFVPGERFDTFIQGVNQFLLANPKELAIFRITHDGIDTDKFTPLNRSEVTTFAQDNVDPNVGFQVQSDLSSVGDQSIDDIVNSGQRMIFLYHMSGVNDSYSDNVYSASLTDPKYIINALNNTVQTSGSNMTMLQLQDTASLALKHYIVTIAENWEAWLNDLVFSKTGNILMATKARFDHATYTWLTDPATVNQIMAQTSLVVIQNDFVDISLAQHALALSKERY